MKTYTIHGNKSEYWHGSNVPRLDSEGNIFPSLTAMARYHNANYSTMTMAEYVRPVNSKLLGKKIAGACIYVDPDIIFNLDQTELAEKLAKYDILFQDYILKKIPAFLDIDGTIKPGRKLTNGGWVYDDFDHWEAMGMLK